MGRTPIGWTDETWNPVRGCSRVSEGCRHCYAEQQAARIVRMGKGKPTPYDGLVSVRSQVSGLRYTSVNAAGAYDDPRWTGKVVFDSVKLAEPLQRKRPRRIFVNSMSDLFHESLTNEQIAAVFGVMAACPQHTFQILTKRARRMREWYEWVAEYDVRMCAKEALLRLGGPHDCRWEKEICADWRWPLRNVWPGVSVEDRKHGVPRIDDLRAVPASVRMLSCEPLLEDLGTLDLSGIGWLIDGCESGEEPRPACPEWFTSLEEQCRAAGVPYFHKQQMIGGKLMHDFPGQQEFPEARRG